MNKEYYEAFVEAVEHERTHPRTDEQFVADMVSKHGMELTLSEFKSGLSSATRTNDTDMVTYYENLIVILNENNLTSSCFFKQWRINKMSKSKKHTISIEDFKNNLVDGKITFKHELAGSYGDGSNKTLLMVTELHYKLEISSDPVARVQYHVMQGNKLYRATCDIQWAINSYNDLP
jgi:hypothetical protein